MRITAAPAIIFVIVLVFLSSGMIDHGVVPSQAFQTEEIQESALMNSRELVYGISRVQKSKNSPIFSNLKVNRRLISNGYKIYIPSFRIHNSIFIHNCCLLI